MSEISKKLDVAANIYTENTTLRALVNGIPHIGSSLDIILASKGRKIVQKRVTDFLEGLKEEFQNLKEASINKEFLESEEFFDLIMRCLNAVTKSRRSEKALIFSKLIRDAAQANLSKDLDEDVLVSIIDDLTPNDIDFLVLLIGYFSAVNRQGKQEVGFYVNDLVIKFPDKDLEYYKVFSNRLEKVGLIYSKTMNTLGNYQYQYFPSKFFLRLQSYFKEIE